MRAPVIPDLRPWFVTPDELPGAPIAWREYFGNDRPVELEVGSGRGLFLTNAATSFPDVNFLGIECDFKEGRRAARRLMKRALPNARIVGGDARTIIPRYIAASSLRGVHVYFPDPWWKRRHRKRRIFSPEFVAQAARILAPGGALHAWTDVEEYFGVIVEVVERESGFRRLPPPPERAPVHDMDYHTSFERKKRKAGLPIFRGRWERVPVTPPGRSAECASFPRSS